VLTQPRNPKGNDVTNHALAFRSLGDRIRNAKRQISDQVHCTADAFAGAQGWTVAHRTGRFGMGARIYRDPRFDTRSLSQVQVVDCVSRQPVRLDQAISDWVRMHDPARITDRVSGRFREAGA
jgi:hypothetical protein